MTYNLVVQATDGTTPDTETITITVTDVAPTVTDTSANMAETAATGATVVDVDNTGDDDSVAWSITTNGADADGDGTAPFAINAGTGVITLADSGDIDFEVTVSYNLVVQATDTNAADTETITITITDVAPTVTDTAGSVSETASNSATIVDVDNTGDDDSVSWSITTNGADADGDGTAPFAINSATGVITLADSGDLDYEVTVTYNLVVQATTGPPPTPRRSPSRDRRRADGETSANMAETAANGATVVDVDNTGDDDRRLSWSITTNGADADSDGTSPFAINAGTGVITLADSGDIDFETTVTYNLVVQATDGTTSTPRRSPSQ